MISLRRINRYPAYHSHPDKTNIYIYIYIFVLHTGGEAERIVLWPLGGFAVLGRTEGGIMEDFWVALAGPLTHIPMAAFWFAMFCVVASPSSFSFNFYFSELKTLKGWFAVLFEQTVAFNMIMFAFNLFIPAYPMDGGRCLAALLVRGGVPVPRAAIITAVTAEIIACCMIAFGIYQVFFNETGVGGIMFILIGVFILYLSHALFRMARAGRVHEHPLFSKECYRNADREQARDGTPGNQSDAAERSATTANVGARTSSTMASNNTHDTEMGTLSWVTPSSGPAPAAAQQGDNGLNVAAPQQDDSDLNVAERLRLGMERMFRKGDSKRNSPPDLTI